MVRKRQTRRRDRPRWVLWLVGFLIVVDLGLLVYVVRRDIRPQQMSDDIFQRPLQGSVQTMGMKPDLQAAELIVPDRPHNLSEVPTPEMAEEFTRRRSFLVSTDARGLRIAEPLSNGASNAELAVPAPGYRIVCLGASITFGWGLAFEESYPARLQQLLGVEVVNAGAPAVDIGVIGGWGVRQLPALDPDLVIVALRDFEGKKALFGMVDELVRAVAPAHVAVVLPPLSSFDYQLDDIGMRYPEAKGEETFDLSGSVARETADATSALDPVPVLDLTVPLRAAQLAYQPASGRPVLLDRRLGEHRLMLLPQRQVIAAFDAPEKDMAPGLAAYFEENTDVYEPYFFDGGHPDAAGTAIMAQLVADWVQTLGWLPNQ